MSVCIQVCLWSACLLLRSFDISADDEKEFSTSFNTAETVIEFQKLSWLTKTWLCCRASCSFIWPLKDTHTHRAFLSYTCTLNTIMYLSIHPCFLSNRAWSTEHISLNESHQTHPPVCILQKEVRQLALSAIKLFWSYKLYVAPKRKRLYRVNHKHNV